MPANSKAIKNRISSVKNTKKITKAMEMVSAAKMRRAVDNALGTRTYAELALELLVNISHEKHVEHALLNNKVKSDRLLCVVIASNKGLCGSFNANIAKQVSTFRDEHKDKKIDFVVVGKNAERIARKSDGEILGSFIEFSDDLKISEISGLTKIVKDEFLARKYESVYLIYTNFVSSINYETESRKLLPISEENVTAMIEKLGKKEKEKRESRISNMALYLFEPSEEEILDQVLPRLTEVQIYQAILESNASEHSARMMAMRNASGAAEDMIEELSLNFNKARQAGITQEIAEIAAGAAALS